MHRAGVLLALGALGGCGGVGLEPYGRREPDTIAGQERAEQSRRQAETLCGPRGEVTQRGDRGNDGTRVTDWKCERPKP